MGETEDISRSMSVLPTQLMLTVFGVSHLAFLVSLFSEMEILIVCGVVAIIGFIGDVVVSAIKRDIGIKDTGSAIPGHGGILDRIDSLALTGPVFFHIVYNLYYV